ncbi:Methylthioribulose-1-phosphate dehydratase [bacterium HR19]|nr:Methylthioribulose-1-phosphate dehydratase [bacterium HR19]
MRRASKLSGSGLKNFVKKMRECGEILFMKGLIDTRSGNASVRIGDKILIKKTGSSMPFLSQKDVIVLPLYKETEEDIIASSDLKLHRKIYIEAERKRKDISAVLHCHMPEAVSLSFFFDKIIPEDYESKLFIREINFSDYESVPEFVSEFKICVVKGHGVFCGGKDFEEALFITLMAHNSLKIFLMNTILKKTVL